MTRNASKLFDYKKSEKLQMDIFVFDNSHPSIGSGRQVNERAKRFRESGDGDSISSQSRDPAVREHVQSGGKDFKKFCFDH